MTDTTLVAPRPCECGHDVRQHRSPPRCPILCVAAGCPCTSYRPVSPEAARCTQVASGRCNGECVTCAEHDAEAAPPRAPTGTFACPICGVTQPHDHDPETKTDWATRPWLVRARRAVGEESFERFMRAALFDGHGRLNPRGDIGMVFRLGQGHRRTAWDSKSPSNPGYDDLAVRALWRAWEAAAHETIAAVRAEEAHVSRTRPLAAHPATTPRERVEAELDELEEMSVGGLRAAYVALAGSPSRESGALCGARSTGNSVCNLDAFHEDTHCERNADGNGGVYWGDNTVASLRARLSTLERDAARMREAIVEFLAMYDTESGDDFAKLRAAHAERL